MIPNIHKPDISTLVTSGHLYFGWTQRQPVAVRESQFMLFFPTKKQFQLQKIGNDP